MFAICLLVPYLDMTLMLFPHSLYHVQLPREIMFLPGHRCDKYEHSRLIKASSKFNLLTYIFSAPSCTFSIDKSPNTFETSVFVSAFHFCKVNSNQVTLSCFSNKSATRYASLLCKLPHKYAWLQSSFLFLNLHASPSINVSLVCF